MDRVARWGREEKDVRLVLLVGSRARTSTPADKWSDADIVIFTRRPADLLGSESWTEKFGTPVLSFLEPTAVGGASERRVLFSDGRDVDFAIFPATSIPQLANSGEGASVLGRGFRVLVDKDDRQAGLSRSLRRPSVPKRTRPPPERLQAVIPDFWYHCVWTAKKLRRGELWVARDCCDGHLKRLLLSVLEWQVELRSSGKVDTWHHGRFLERWAAPRTVARLKKAFARYDRPDVERALRSTMDLFHDVATDTASRLGVPYPIRSEIAARRMIDGILPG